MGHEACHGCQTNTEPGISVPPNDAAEEQRNVGRVKRTERKAILPIGRTARLAFQVENLRVECCKAAHTLTSQMPFDENELEECARLDDALAKAHRLLKSTVGQIIISRLHRRSRTS